MLKLRSAVALEEWQYYNKLEQTLTAFSKFRTSCDFPANSTNVSETVTAVVWPCSSSSSKLFSGIFLMNKNGQHSYQFLMIFHFGITI